MQPLMIFRASALRFALMSSLALAACGEPASSDTTEDAAWRPRPSPDGDEGGTSAPGPDGGYRPPPVPDAGPRDGSMPDAAMDGALADAAVSDASVPDGSFPDAARPDGALPDGDVPDDAAPIDGSTDASTDGDASDGAIPTDEGAMIVSGPRVIASGSCEAFSVRLAAAHGTGSFLVSLSSSIAGSFYTANTCSGATTDALSIERDGTASSIYFKASLPADDFVAEAELMVSTDAREAPLAVEVRRAAKEVAVGRNFSCALLDDGSVWCWGARDRAFEADEVYPSVIADRPSRVTGISGANVRSLVAGNPHACVLVGDAVRCWGRWDHLGNPSDPDSPVVTPEGLDAQVTALDAFAHHACAVKAGAVYCWGTSEDGLASTPMTPKPSVVAGLEAGAVGVATGSGHVCAQMQAGGVKCVGSNGLGQLGDTTSNDATTAVDVQGIGTGTVHELHATYYSTCALVDDALKCWGLGFTKAAATVTGFETNVTKLGLGSFHGCALASDALQCWGDNGVGQLGVTPSDVLGPPGAAPSGLEAPIAAVAAGYSASSCAVSRGLVYCWGRNREGEVGASEDLHRFLAPTAVPAMTGKSVSRFSFSPDGAVANCAVYDGKTHCWGANDRGALGRGNADEASSSVTPQEVSNLGAPSTLVSYGSRTCAIEDGKIMCWGADFVNGNASVVPTEITLPNGEAPLDVCVGNGHACALTDGPNPGAYCWGSDGQGQLGDAADHAASVTVPVLAETADVPTAISCGDTRTCAVVDGGVQCWGETYGLASPTPVDVLGLEPSAATHDPVEQIAIAYLTGCALTDAGEAWCWFNDQTAELVTLPKPADAIVAGSWANFCARDADGLVCWGTNDDGQVGNGAATDSMQPPTRVPDLVPPIGAFATGLTSCAVDAEGFKCWGSNAGRTLGGDAALYTSTPTLTRAFAE